MNEPAAPIDGAAIPAVHGDPTPTPDTGVPVPSSPPAVATGPASRTPERDAAAGPPGVPPARPGDQAAPAPGLRGQAYRDEAKRILAEQGKAQRGDPGRRARYAQRATPAYRPGGNRRGGRG